MLTIYRRHRKSCSHRGHGENRGRRYRRCQCPIWVAGLIGEVRLRRSLGTRDWQKAQEIVREWEADGQAKQEEQGPITVKTACDSFENDAKARGLREPTLYKYRLLFSQLQTFCEGAGVRFIHELDLGLCRRFRESWKQENLSALKTLERLRAFFRFCQESGWVKESPARGLKNPRVTQSPTLPFDSAEIVKILKACDGYNAKHPKAGRLQAHRVKALVLLLRYSGLRIRDAVTLERDRITNGKLMLYQAKTGTAVYCPLPPLVVQALECLPATRYFFWSGESDPKSAVGDWQRTLRRVFTLAEVPSGHAHRFRDTFAVELLKAGVPLDRVSVLLGHQSTRVTERHYSPWVRERQEQLEADVRRTWALPQTKDTQEVHGESGLVN
ncbi:MAG: site-specific integrase [Acidobacteria bacterium]|nr:site-specific integrase [Acidobacteriota bacterium]